MSKNAINKQTDTNLDFSAKSELFAIERCLKNYTAHLIKKITSGLSSTMLPADVLEFGAGIGALAAEYNVQNAVKPDCIEIDLAQTQILKERGFSCYSSTNCLRKKYDAIYTSNVLEHIENDTASIKELYGSLKPGGRLAIYVPAFMLLWSDMDEMVGHYRRYSKKELCQKVSSVGFKIISCHYVDCIGFLMWFCLRIKGYKKGDATASDVSLKFFDKVLFPISRFFDFLGCRFFFGKSLLLIATKPVDYSLCTKVI